MGVYFYHFGKPDWVPQILWGVELNGLLGVQFFFVLSGYVLMIRYAKQRISFRRFVLARLARIGPMYGCGLLLSLAYLRYSDQSSPLGLFVVHIFGVQSWSANMDNAVAYNGPAWTVSVELFFYLLFPTIILLVQSTTSIINRGVLLVLAGTALGALLTMRQAISYGPLDHHISEIPNDFIWFPLVPVHYLGLFITGVGAASLGLHLATGSKTRLFHRLINPWITVSLILGALLVINFNSPNHPYLALSARFWLAGPPFAVLLLSLHLHQQNLLARACGSSPVRYLGQISYAFYILHVPLTWFLQSKNPNLSYETKFMAILVSSVLLFHSFEKPLHRMISPQLRNGSVDV